MVLLHIGVIVRMISVTTQRERRDVQRLPFCYLCGKAFEPGDKKNRDHVPPDAVFKKDHKDPLILPTHISCNSGHGADDEKIAQLIALRYGKVPRDPSNRRLDINRDTGALTNLNIDRVVWRWISGFHAALYREPALQIRLSGALVTPFPRGRLVNGVPVIDELLPQHNLFVQALKTNRAIKNTDRVSCNKGQVTYECVWYQADNGGSWMCFFGLDIYDWKDLGHKRGYNPRGCAGAYSLLSRLAPADAAKGIANVGSGRNEDKLDPFAP